MNSLTGWSRMQAREAPEEDDNCRYTEEADEALTEFDAWIGWRNAAETPDDKEEFV